MKLTHQSNNCLQKQPHAITQLYCKPPSDVRKLAVKEISVVVHRFWN